VAAVSITGDGLQGRPSLKEKKGKRRE